MTDKAQDTHKKNIFQKIGHVLFHSPTESDLGLPPGKDLSKKETLQVIEHAVSHPLHPNQADKAVPKRQESDHVWDEKKIPKDQALHEIEQAWEHPFRPHH